MAEDKTYHCQNCERVFEKGIAAAWHEEQTGHTTKE